MDVTPGLALSHDEQVRIRAAAVRAERLFPGPLGKWLARDLNSWSSAGFRLDQTGLTARMIEFLLKAPLPSSTEGTS